MRRICVAGIVLVPPAHLLATKTSSPRQWGCNTPPDTGRGIIPPDAAYRIVPVPGQLLGDLVLPRRRLKLSVTPGLEKRIAPSQRSVLLP